RICAARSKFRRRKYRDIADRRGFMVCSFTWSAVELGDISPGAQTERRGDAGGATSAGQRKEPSHFVLGIRLLRTQSQPRGAKPDNGRNFCRTKRVGRYSALRIHAPGCLVVVGQLQNNAKNSMGAAHGL